MSKTSPKTAADLGEMARANQHSLEAAAHLHARMMRDGMRFQAELMDFARRRLGAEIETQDRLSRCHTLAEAAEVVNDFYRTAMRDYSDEAGDLVKLCVGMAAEQAEATVAEAKTAPETPQAAAMSAAAGGAAGKG